MNVCVPLGPIGPVPGLRPLWWTLAGRPPWRLADQWVTALTPTVHEWRHVIDAGAEVELVLTLPARRAHLSLERRRTVEGWGRAIVIAACARYRVLPLRILVTITYDTATVTRWCDAALYIRKDTP